MKNRFIFTCGDINGIGPEIVIKTLEVLKKKSTSKFYVLCPPSVFEHYYKLSKSKFQYEISENFNDADSVVTVIPLKDLKLNYGKPTKNSGKISFEAIKIAVKFVNEGSVEAIVTAPISKTAINMAGINFPGHTEMLAEWTSTNDFVMTFLSKKMKSALVTIHNPLKKVPGLITEKNLHSTFNVVLNSLRNDLNIDKPKVAVLGLNPHAGESGIIGTEEENIIKPSILSFQNNQFLSGPFSPDAFFANRRYKKFDLVIGMYHDQVLIPFKMLNFGGGVNYTAGLPIIRTSPDHGVAYDIAGRNLANPASFLEAVRYAGIIIKNRKRKAKNSG
jgi:4-hydroxythreonine-4-phosphate dehydrogenase